MADQTTPLLDANEIVELIDRKLAEIPVGEDGQPTLYYKTKRRAYTEIRNEIIPPPPKVKRAKRQPAVEAPAEAPEEAVPEVVEEATPVPEVVEEVVEEPITETVVEEIEESA